jgi:hypothetical protein
MNLDEGELSRRGAIVAAALVSTGVLASVGGVLVPTQVAAESREEAAAEKERRT